MNRLYEINDIIDKYSEQGYILTLRQLYYQLVSSAIISNDDREYKKLCKLLGKGRMAGFVDWDAIEDRLRVPYIHYHAADPVGGINDLLKQYRLDRQIGQEKYIEIWVEKDALSGVIRKVTDKYHVKLMVNRGYSSITAMREAYIRMKDALVYNQEPIIFYLGDHDPSGLDMVRDITERITEFGSGDVYIPEIASYEDTGGEWFQVKHIALTVDQISQYKPPPNPAKITDPRAKWYISKFGNTSWEVDALPPNVLLELIEEAILGEIDINKYDEVMIDEEEDKKTLKRLRNSVNG